MNQLPVSTDLRQQIRKTIRQQRRALTAEQQAHFAERAAARMLGFAPVMEARAVAVFLSFDGELDTRPLIEGLWRAGKQVYLPVLHPFSPGNLLFLRYLPDSLLSTNRLKILEPALDVRHVLPLDRLDVLVTPLVAFDRAGQRLGMGGVFTIAPCNTGATTDSSRSVTRTTASRWSACRWKSGIFRCLR